MIIENQGRFGFDVSKWQSDPIKKIRINFETMKNYGASFVIPKIGQYNYYDYDADYNWLEAKNAGILRGSYWFLDYRDTGKNQAQKHFDFLEKHKDMGEGVHFVDYENGSGGDWRKVYDFIAEFQRLSGLPNHKIGIYTGYYYWIENSPYMLEQRKWFSRYPLWLAWYINNAPITSVQDILSYYLKYSSQVRVPDTWIDASVLIWQAGTPAIGKVVGAQSLEIDFCLLNGGDDMLKLHFGSGEIPVPPVIQPPTNGGTTTVYNLVVLAEYLNGRAAMWGSLNFPAGATLSTGFRKDDVLEADTKQRDADGADWYRITKCTRNGQPVQIPNPVWACAGATYGFLRLYTPAPETPTNPTVPANEIYLSLTPDGERHRYILSPNQS